MGRSAYWNAGRDSLASLALGDANRGAFLALQSAVSTRRRPVATDPPERRASSCFGGFGETQLCRRAALLGPDAASSVAPVASAMAAPCVLASERASHPDDERRSAKPSWPVS